MQAEAPLDAVSSRPLPEGFLPSNCTYSERDWPVLARQWFPVCRADDALAKPRQVVVLNLRLVVYRMPDGIRVGRDMCPHRGLPLSGGRVEGDELVCAYHGLRFGSDGQCTKVPEKLAPKAADCFKVTMFPAIERHRLVWTCLIPEAGPKVPGGNSDSPFKLSIDHLYDSMIFEFMDESGIVDPENHQILKKLGISEYQRLLAEIGFSSEMIPSSSSFS